MRLFILFISILTISSAISAQAPSITLSKEFDRPEGNFVTDKILSLGDNFAIHSVEYETRYIFGSKDKISAIKNSQLLIHDQELNLISTIDLPHEGISKSIETSSIQDNLVWVYERRETYEGPISFEAQIIHPDGTFGAKTKILSYDRREKNSHQLLSAISNDKSKYACVLTQKRSNYSYLGKKDTVNTTFTFLVLDNTGKTITLDSFKVNVSKNQFEIIAVGVDDDGKGYVVGREYEEGNIRARFKNSTSVLNLYTITLNSSEITKSPFNIDDNYISQLKFITNGNTTPILFGTYSEYYKGPPIGLFYTKNLNGDLNLELTSFEVNDLNKMGSTIVKTTKKNKPYIKDDFLLSDAYFHANGNISVFLDAYDYIPSTRPGDHTIPPQHVFLDGLLLTLSIDNSIDKIMTFPKRQESSYNIKSWNGSRLYNFEGKYAVIYNDNPKNFTPNNGKNLKELDPKKGAATISYTDQNDKFVIKPMFSDSEAENMLINLRSITELENGTLVFLAYKIAKKSDRKKYSLGKLKM